MACCIIGSLIFTLLVGLTRWIKLRILGKTPEKPELWRLSDEPI
ncbi:MAG: hypothetical protein R3208_20355 [Ketobacteraceae bacterium]|nr:hypothetical protein [Ketobacteraceae bacterium]